MMNEHSIEHSWKRTLSILPLVREEGIHVYWEQWTSSQIHEETALAPHSAIKTGTQQTQAGIPGASIFPITSVSTKNTDTHNTAYLHLSSRDQFFHKSIQMFKSLQYAKKAHPN